MGGDKKSNIDGTAHRKYKERRPSFKEHKNKISVTGRIWKLGQPSSGPQWIGTGK
jgi:hypothetical protein